MKALRVIKIAIAFPLLAVALVIGIVAEVAKAAAMCVLVTCADWINNESQPITGGTDGTL